jgi:hypothetical protein
VVITGGRFTVMTTWSVPYAVAAEQLPAAVSVFAVSVTAPENPAGGV